MSDSTSPNEGTEPKEQPHPYSSANEQAPLPELNEFDLAGGKLAPGQERSINDLIEWNQHRRRMQWWTFVALGFVCLIFLFSLMRLMFKMISDKEVLAVVVHANDWHVLTFLGIALIVFASVPLSLALAILKMVSQPGIADSKESRDDAVLTTPQLELLKAIIDAFKAFKGA